MPNWIQGTMKIRGMTENVLNFIVNGIESVAETDTYGDKEINIQNFAYIKGSRRAFIDGSQCVFVDLSKRYQTIAIPVRQAWSFTPAEGEEMRWINLSKEYSVDIRLQGFECGMEFYQDFAVCNGEVTVDAVKEYEDWLWECPMPLLGG